MAAESCLQKCGEPTGAAHGFTIIELVIVIAIISTIAAIAVPQLSRAKLTGNETSARASLEVLTSAQAAYSTSCGQSGYASSFVVLGTPAPGSSAGFISADLGTVAAPQKTGYTFTLGAGAGAGAGPPDCNGAATVTAFYASAVPLTLGTTGSRSFATNAGHTIWQVNAAVAPTEPFGAPARPIQ